MSSPIPSAMSTIESYSARLQAVLQHADWSGVVSLAEHIRICWLERRQIFLCGNGGSAGNAVHLANDFVYGVSKKHGLGLRASALSANISIVTCLANDEGYAEIYSKQLAVQAQAGDVLIVLSGSGNSQNIIKALIEAQRIGMRSFAILGYSGGQAKLLADSTIHFPVNDMQIAEDLQLVVGHMAMQWLYQNQPSESNPQQ